MNRRDVLAGTGVVGLASLSGCLGVLGLDEHESAPAGVDQSVLEETGYQEIRTEPLGVDENVDLLLYSETVTVTNYLTEYDKSVDLGPLGSLRAAVFNVLTTPQVDVLGQELNPIEEMSTEEVMELVKNNYDGFGDVTHEADESVSVLGQEATMSRFSASAKFDGADLDVFIHVTEAIQTSEDHLVAIGVYPEQTQGREEANVFSLVEGVIEDASGAE
ncbi:DUF6517 family protein [Saliphagus sp. GCM10025334]